MRQEPRHYSEAGAGCKPRNRPRVSFIRGRREEWNRRPRVHVLGQLPIPALSLGLLHLDPAQLQHVLALVEGLVLDPQRLGLGGGVLEGGVGVAIGFGLDRVRLGFRDRDLLFLLRLDGLQAVLRGQAQLLLGHLVVDGGHVRLREREVAHVDVDDLRAVDGEFCPQRLVDVRGNLGALADQVGCNVTGGDRLEDLLRGGLDVRGQVAVVGVFLVTPRPPCRGRCCSGLSGDLDRLGVAGAALGVLDVGLLGADAEAASFCQGGRMARPSGSMPTIRPNCVTTPRLPVGTE